MPRLVRLERSVRVLGKLAFIVEMVSDDPIMPESHIEIGSLPLALGWHIKDSEF